METADAVSESEPGCPDQDWTHALKTPRGRNLEAWWGVAPVVFAQCPQSFVSITVAGVDCREFFLPVILSGVGRERLGQAQEKMEGRRQRPQLLSTQLFEGFWGLLMPRAGGGEGDLTDNEMLSR